VSNGQHEPRYTKRQTLRGSRPDAQIVGKIYLIKNVSTLRATYQVRLLTYLAVKSGGVLILRVPGHFEPSESLRLLIQEYPRVIRIEKT
jgi:hypothetical protein